MAREMKESGIEWIGEIPKDWEIQKGKNCLKYVEKPIKSDDKVITCFRDGEVTLRSNRREDGFTISTKEIGYQGIDMGDLVVHGMDGFAGAIGISDSRGKASPVLNVLETSNNKRYIMYYLRNMAYSGIFLALSTGIRIRTCDTNWKKLKELFYILPPLEEQQQIAEYLDKKIADIDLIIEKTKTTIEDYKKYKQSIITEAVTKGLNPNVEMKDSGIEWIGQIPKHWKIFPIKYILKWKSEKNHPNERVLSLYRDLGVIPKDSRSDNHNVTSEDTSTYKFVEKGDFVINKMKAWQGSMAVSEYQGIISPAYHICAFTTNQINKKYFHHLLRNHLYLPEFRRLSTGLRIGQWDLGFEDFKNIPYLYPTLDEQQQIAEYLDKKIAEIDNLIAKKESLISEMEEYKKSLIYECVTGKKEIV